MRWLIALLTVAVLVLAGCGSPGTPSTDAPGLIGAGRTADLDFTGTTLDGEPFDGNTLEGRPAVIWFWAPWCPTCRAQSATVDELADRYGGEVAVIGVGGLDSREAIEQVAAQIPHVTHLVDADGQVWKHFRVTAQSTYSVIAPDGEILAEGYLDNDELIALVERLAG